MGRTPKRRGRVDGNYPEHVAWPPRRTNRAGRSERRSRSSRTRASGGSVLSRIRHTPVIDSLKGGVPVEAASTAPPSNIASGEAPQHMRALERANMVRLARAELKRSIARGDMDAAEVVRDCPWETESMTIAELLTSQRRWGRTRARKFLMPLALNENKQLGTLTARQRRLLAQELASRSADREPLSV